MRITDLIAQDHRTVEQLFGQLESMQAGDRKERQALLETLGEELEVHAQTEEAVFYPALRSVSQRVEHAQHEHREARTLLAAVQGRDPGSSEFTEGVRKLKAAVLHHAKEEEASIFPEAERLGQAELERLATEWQQRKETLKTSIVQRGMRAAKQAAQKIA